MICQYCGKECKNSNSLKNHERLCKLNPNRQISGWTIHNYNKNAKHSNQFIKANEEGYEYQISDETIEKFKTNIWKNKKLPKNMKEKIKNTVKQNIENNNWHLSFSKARTIEYKGYLFQGSWEVAFAKYLDNKNIKWERPNKTYTYIYENEIHKYLPDFYLP